jgi:hypothetical protein
MGLLSRFFGRKPSADDLLIESAFKRLSSFFESEELQNEPMSEGWKRLIAGRTATDRVPGGHGAFGRCLTNPVPVNGVIGVGFYLSSLRINRGPILFHRLGSFEQVDCFEVVSADGSIWDLLYLDMYYPRRSRHAPEGYSIDNSDSLVGRFYGTNRRVEPFPHALYGAIAEYTAKFIGRAWPNPKVREILAAGRFVAPETHRRRVDEIVRSRVSLAPTDAEMAPERPTPRDGGTGNGGSTGGNPCKEATTRVMLLLEQCAAKLPGFSILDAQGRMKPKPTAYVYGFVEAALAVAGVRIGLDETDLGNLSLAIVLMHCVAIGRGVSAADMSTDEQDRWLAYASRMIRWINDNAQNGGLDTAKLIGREDYAAWARGDVTIRWGQCFQ